MNRPTVSPGAAVETAGTNFWCLSVANSVLSVPYVA
jgi:hypothetical protein